MDGDIFFASESNLLNRTSRIIFAGSYAGVGSSTDGIIAGSIVIGAGSIFNPSILRIYTNTNGGSQIILLSGAATNFNTSMSGTWPADSVSQQWAAFTAYLGSPVGILIAEGGGENLGLTAKNFTSSSFQTNNPNSGLVINFSLKHVNAGDRLYRSIIVVSHGSGNTPRL